MYENSPNDFIECRKNGICLKNRIFDTRDSKRYIVNLSNSYVIVHLPST